ncbi:MAG: leucyl/phenylalanyl-tRNA--protein transferase [Gammaproteobacteria bacterium]
MSGLPWIPPDDELSPFPDPDTALREPDGLLAAGGQLTTRRLKTAYRQGIFPWFSEGQPILWWSPDPRMVLFADELKISRSLRKTLRRTPENGGFEYSLDRAFEQVVEACSAPRPGQHGTWITDTMKDAYLRLHREGAAHSVETWHDGALAGGLYGVAIGKVFFGESMFVRQRDASKAAFALLVSQLRRWGFPLIDCQVHTTHLESLGARPIRRTDFNGHLAHWCAEPGRPGPWRLDLDSPLNDLVRDEAMG